MKTVFINGKPSAKLEIKEEHNDEDISLGLKRIVRGLTKNKLEDFTVKFSEDKIFLDDKTVQTPKMKVISKGEKCGRIRIAQQAKGRSYPVVKDFITIPCWSRGKGEYKQLSPFYLTWNDGQGDIIFENYWQNKKVWRKVAKQNKKDWVWSAEVHVDEEDNPNEAWFRWNEALKYHDQAVRRPNGKEIPLYAYWEGRKLDVVEARREIYIPKLKELYRSHPVYAKLLKMVREGKSLLLIEPDGSMLDAYPDGQEVDLPLLESLISVTNYGPEGYPNKYRAYGHSFVLATCLLEDC